MKLEKDAWKKRGWIRGDQLPGGNQGLTHLVRREGDAAEAFNYVLKSLKRQEDDVRRARFAIEAQSLAVVENSGVAILVDSNANDFRQSVELFLITERITGIDLDSLVRNARPP